MSTPFSFGEKVPSFDSTRYMISFEIESLYTSIPLEETTNICVNKLFHDKTKIYNLSKESFESLLDLDTLDSFSIFAGKY